MKYKNKFKDLKNFCEEYKKFISNNKTERECVSFFVKEVKENGFASLHDFIDNKQTLKAGDSLFCVGKDKSLALIKIGKEDIEKGCVLIGSHIDSPRLDLKSLPFVFDSNMAFLDTHYYGGIRKHQWLTTPLALRGFVVKKNGEKIQINIGDNPNDPVFVITDILPHLSQNVNIEKLNGERLDILSGLKTVCEDKECDIAEKIFKILKDQGVEKEDLISSEIEIVPAGEARDLGFDRSMILGYGHDDRSCAFASFSAFMQVENPKKTCVCLFVDKEETGSVGSTGAKSHFLENTIDEVCFMLGKKHHLSCKRALSNTVALSADVTAGFDPLYRSVMNKNTACFLGKGIGFKKYGGSCGKRETNDSNPEFIAKIRKILDEKNIAYQFSETGKVDEGGGSTIAYMLARYGMEILDGGVPILSMHAPWETISKFDIFECFKAYKAFYLD